MRIDVHTGFGLLATAAVAATVALGFALTGSPETRRLERLDQRRLDELREIHDEIQRLVRDPDDADVLRRPLPSTLDELAERARFARIERFDPETGAPYGYATRGETVYELTATFALPRDADHAVFWNHPAGRHTFRVDALDPP